MALSSPATFIFALVLGAIVAVVFAVRRPAIPRFSCTSGFVGVALICVAAGGPFWRPPSPVDVAVMVDLSPSTRSADYRTRARLESRVRSLLGKTPFHISYFASGIVPFEPTGETLADIRAEQTVFQPPAGSAAVVVVTDARFQISAGLPPTYIVLDPGLETPSDASVTALRINGRDVTATLSNSGPPRQILIDGVTHPASVAVPGGTLSLTHPLDSKAPSISARLSPGDLWPENDQLTAFPPPAARKDRWWVGMSQPGAGWRAMSTADLPASTVEYLEPSIIVLENISAADLSMLQQQRLQQYVRDLGGGLAILGGDRAFAAGGYPGSALEALTPLGSTPPTPTTHWMLLADGSGSMAEVQNGFSLWQRAADAMLKLMPHLPLDDVLSIGSFSDSLTWWTTGKSVRETLNASLPPTGTGPHGPTNLEDALLEVARSTDGALPTQLLLMTDAEAEIKDPASLVLALHQKKIHLHVLAIGQGSALPALRIILGGTGGTMVTQFDPAKWSDAIQTLMPLARTKLLGRDALAVNFVGELSTTPAADFSPWNRTWMKSSATLLGEGKDGEERVPAAAFWHVGEGRVLACAFDPGQAMAESVTRVVSGPPRRPAISRDLGCRRPLARNSGRALDGTTCLNGQRLVLDLAGLADTSSASSTYAIPQTGPGRYELDLPAPRTPALATVRVDGDWIDRIAVAGRYAPEFDAIGNDHDAMRQLASQTGGQVIPTRQTWPIDFHWPARLVPLGSILATFGAVFDYCFGRMVEIFRAMIQ